jgi:endonuclease YncB( thermonuclease family)
MFRHIIIAAFLIAALARPSFADVAGPASVIDGDTVVVAGERIRLQGIDAPELHQMCTAYGQPWACGRTSAEWLKEQLNGREIECVGHARDRYGRLLAVCYVGGEDLNERIVREGWALDYRKYSRRTFGRRRRPSARRWPLARRVHPALGVARRTPLTLNCRFCAPPLFRSSIMPRSEPRPTT